jgi:hypothetical protein
LPTRKSPTADRRSSARRSPPAGTAFGRDVEAPGSGGARCARALIGKVLDDGGSGNSDMLFRGIQWAATSRALEAYRANLRMFDALMQLSRRPVLQHVPSGSPTPASGSCPPRQAAGPPAAATTVKARVLAHADIATLAPSVDVADRGVGITRAPDRGPWRRICPRRCAPLCIWTILSSSTAALSAV